MRQLCPESFIEVMNSTFLVCAYRFRHTCNNWRLKGRSFRDNSPALKMRNRLVGRSDSKFCPIDEVREFQRKECGNRIEEFQGWIAAHLGLANMANVVAKAISKLLLGQLLSTA